MNLPQAMITIDEDCIFQGVIVKHEYKYTYVREDEHGNLSQKTEKSGWTSLSPHLYAKKHNVSIVKTSKRERK